MTEKDEAAEKSDYFGNWRRRLREAKPVLLPGLMIPAVFFPVLALQLRWPPWVTVSIGTISLLLSLFVLNYLLSPQRSPWFWRGLLCAAILVYAWSLSYQAGVPARALRYQAWATPQLPDSPENLTLAIAYPRIVPLEAPDKLGWPLSVYLWPPVLPITPTAIGATTATTLPGQTAAPAVTETAPAQTPTPITLTPTRAMSYTVAFVPYDNGLLFTDEKGVPVAPQVRVKPGQSSEKPAVLYVRRAPMDTVPTSVSITVQIYGPDGIPRELATLKIRLEDAYDAWWRHFKVLVLGPTTPLLALAATLVGFAWQWWQEGQKRKQAGLDEIRKVETLVSQGKLEEAKQKLIEVTTRYSREPALRDDLTKARKRVQLARIRHCQEVLAPTERDEALRQYEELRNEREEEAWTDPELIASLEQAGAAIKSLPLCPPRLWPEEAQRPDLPAIIAWLKESGTDLRFNPFGPERAEDDSLLPQLFVEPPGWELVKAPEPTVVFGANGSGRTASLLLLAHTCTTTGLGPDGIRGQVNTFPVRLALFPEGKPEDAAVTCWRMVTRSLAQDSLEFLARNSQTFAETPSRQQRALARLFMMHRHYLGDLAEYLSGVGLEDRAVARHLANSIRRAARGTRPPAPTDEAELLSTLAEARPSHFQQHYVLVEVPDEVITRFSPQEIAPYLEPLLKMMKSLAAQKVYIKLFTPTNLENALESLAPGINKIELTWEAPALREMVERRVQQTGAPSFRALFRHLPEGIDPAALLVQVALKSEGPPRRLIQLGQELLAEHIRHAPGDPKLRWEELKAVLDKSAQGGGS